MASRSATQALKKWVEEHEDDPYPSNEEKEQLMEMTGLDRQQLDHWFVNARQRYCKPSAAKRRGPNPCYKRYTSKMTAVLTDWLLKNCDYPYPNSDELKSLMEKTGLNKKQLQNWFTNARKRKLVDRLKNGTFPYQLHCYAKDYELPHARPCIPREDDGVIAADVGPACTLAGRTTKVERPSGFEQPVAPNGHFPEHFNSTTRPIVSPNHTNPMYLVPQQPPPIPYSASVDMYSNLFSLASFPGAIPQADVAPDAVPNRLAQNTYPLTPLQPMQQQQRALYNNKRVGAEPPHFALSHLLEEDGRAPSPGGNAENVLNASNVTERENSRDYHMRMALMLSASDAVKRLTIPNNAFQPLQKTQSDKGFSSPSNVGAYDVTEQKVAPKTKKRKSTISLSELSFFNKPKQFQKLDSMPEKSAPFSEADETEEAANLMLNFCHMAH